MYRMLIVDDEPIIVDGLFDLFQQLAHLPLEVYRAYDGKEAMELSRRARMDIVLTDIEMPEMNGIELQEQLNKLWPKCKVIFLTGYTDFNYIQSSIRNGGIDYVLKTEGDEQIIKAVEKAIRQIAEEHTFERLIDKARDQMTIAIPSLRREYLLELLEGEPSTESARLKRFTELGIPLQADQPVFMAAGRVDSWREDFRSTDKALFLYSINNIFEEYFAQTFHTVHLIYAKERFLWLLQPKTGYGLSGLSSSPDGLTRYVLNMLESIQSSCKEYLKLPCSFVVSSEPCGWNQVSFKFDTLSILFVRGLGIDGEMLLSDKHLFEAEQQERAKLRKMQLLGQYLDQKDEGKFMRVFTEIVGTIDEQSTVHTGMALEIFYSLSAMFISCLNRWSLLQEISALVDVKKLFSIHEHASWVEATGFFRQLAAMLFERKINENEVETSKVVRQIHEYVELHLHGDLSLNQLSEIVYLTPFYLSRLYKQKTGKSLTDHITEIKVNKAKELLSQTPMKIHEVGAMIGYESPPYFTRFFKKATQLTPQEFRDSTN